MNFLLLNILRIQKQFYIERKEALLNSVSEVTAKNFQLYWANGHTYGKVSAFMQTRVETTYYFSRLMYSLPNNWCWGCVCVVKVSIEFRAKHDLPISLIFFQQMCRV